MRVFHFSLIVLLSLSLHGFLAAQSGPGAYAGGYARNGNTFFFSNERADVRLEFCTPSMIRVRTSWNRKFEDNEPWMVVAYQWPEMAISASEEKARFVFQTARLKVIVQKTPFAVDVFTAEGAPLLSETALKGSGGAQKEGDAVLCRKQLGPDEHFFGFGERMDFVDQRNKLVKLNVGRGNARPHIIGAYNVLQANYCPVPFFMSTRGYGIFLHNSFANEWDMGATQPGAYSFKAKNGELDYYVIYGPTFPAILDQYTQLTGKAPLMPQFALGLQVGTYSGGTWGHEEKTSGEYVVHLVRKFRELGIPIDILHLDSTWRVFGKNGGKGATSFEWRETFTNPKSMFDSLYAMHINLAGVHIRPRFDNGNKLTLLDQARTLGYTYKEGGNPGEFVNFFDPKAVDWWWQNGVMNVAGIGARFFKTDEGSAFGSMANESDKVGPTGLEAEKLHNVFPIAYAKAPYEKFSAFNGMRGMNHTREGYAGIQRYPFIFAGDWPSEWQYFAPVIKAGINIGLSGVGNWAHCMGGFEHDADPELYIRWCQFGLLSPVAHLFGMDHPGYKEPWNYGEEGLKNFKKYTLFRYRLLPYLYSHSYDMYRTGMPLMRALALEYQEDENVYAIADQYFLGSQMMVCPVTVKGAQTREVYLPEGTWFDYTTGKKYEGKQYLQVLTPLDQIPILVKGGAIIPLQEPVQYIGEKPANFFTLEIFPKGESAFTLYDDDGTSLDYQKGIFAQTNISCKETGGEVLVVIDTPKGPFAVVERSYLLAIRRDSAPALVTSAGTALPATGDLTALKQASSPAGWHYDAENKVLYVQPGGNNRTRIQVTVK
ncbi:MAG: glycoside hydrolase family 31 protein [Haliscomenobacter sp.]|nr:glycoside hydrolase family 31 protein [Haliscomenobacter sp.]MBP9872606.1 glycoside hydrolase family 31 protein [Haliscomenobacter sp.]